MLVDNIKKAAAVKRISISALERKAGLAKGHIYKWNIFTPNLESICKVAEILDVTVDELISDCYDKDRSN